MKKFFILIASASLMLGLSSCSKDSLSITPRNGAFVCEQSGGAGASAAKSNGGGIESVNIYVGIRGGLAIGGQWLRGTGYGPLYCASAGNFKDGDDLTITVKGTFTDGSNRTIDVTGGDCSVYVTGLPGDEETVGGVIDGICASTEWIEDPRHDNRSFHEVHLIYNGKDYLLCDMWLGFDL